MTRVVPSALVAVAVVSIALLTPAMRAEAADASFDLTVTHDTSASDHVVVLTVTTATADDTGPQTLNLFLRSDLDNQLRPLSGRNGIDVQLLQIDPRTARANVALPTDGEWVVLPFTDVAESDFAPLQRADEIPIISFTVPWSGTTTRIRPPKSSSSTGLLVAAIGGGAVVAAVLALTVFRLTDRRRSAVSDSGEVAPDDAEDE